MKSTLALAALSATLIALTGCNKKEPSQQVKSNGLPKAGTQVQAQGGVAVVDIDSIAAQAEYCKQGLKGLEAKQLQYRKQLNAKGQALEKGMMDFQQKLQNGGFTSEEQAKAAQSKLQKQQQSLQQYQSQIEGEMAKATEAYQEKLRADIAAFLKEYNKDGRYSVIISKSGDNVLYMSPSVDITNDVIAGLNKAFKK